MKKFYKKLVDLIMNSQNEEAKLIIEKFNLYHKVDSYGHTILHYCGMHNNQIMAKYLIEKGCDLNARDCLGNTALKYTLMKRHEEVAKILLDAGVDVLVKDFSARSALLMFIDTYSRLSPIFESLRDNFRRQFSSSEEAAKKLIELHYRLDQVVFLKDAKIVEYMLDNGFQDSLSKSYRVKSVRRKGTTLLHLAVLLHDVETVKVLVKYGADVDTKDSVGYSPIFCVYTGVINDHPNEIEILRVLLNAATPMFDRSPLFAVLIRGPREAIRVLLESGLLDFETEDAIHGTAWHYLAQNVNPGVSEELKGHTAKFNVNVVSEESKMTPLQLTAFYANPLMMQFFLDQGANVNFVHESRPFPALFMAYANYKLKNESDVCIELLLRRSADPQYILGNDGDGTIFDVKTSGTKKGKLRLLVAHLAMSQKLGTAITEIIQSKIDSQPSLKKYLTLCQQVLDEKVAGVVTVSQLLTADQKLMAKYLNKRKLVMKFVRIHNKENITSRYAYYYNTLVKRISKGFLYKTLKDKAAAVISRLLEYRLNESNIIVEQIIGYLDEQALRQLYITFD